MNKINPYIIIVLLIALVGLFFFYKNEVNDLNNEIFDLKEEKKSELKAVRDSAQVAIDDRIEKSTKSFDSLFSLKNKIKYIPYEKFIYADRGLDEALNIIEFYSYNKN